MIDSYGGTSVDEVAKKRALQFRIFEVLDAFGWTANKQLGRITNGFSKDDSDDLKEFLRRIKKLQIVKSEGGWLSIQELKALERMTGRIYKNAFEDERKAMGIQRNTFSKLIEEFSK